MIGEICQVLKKSVTILFKSRPIVLLAHHFTLVSHDFLAPFESLEGMLMLGGESLFYNTASANSQMVGNKLKNNEGVSFSVIDHLVSWLFHIF